MQLSPTIGKLSLLWLLMIIGCVELTITLFAERQNIEQGLDSRVFFNNSERRPQQMVVGTFSRGQEQCFTETVFVKVCI